MGPVAAWAIPAAVSVIGGLYSAYKGNQARQKQDMLMKQQQGISDETLPTARSQLAQSQQALTPALSYYTGVLANPREATAPEQNRIGALYQGQAANVRNMYPRGGYGPAAAENLRSQQRAASENVIQQGRPMAAGALTNLGTSLGSLGYQGMGLGAGILGNVFQQGLAARQQQFSQGSAIGGGLFNAYQSYLLGQALKGTGTGQGYSTDTSGSVMPSTGYSTGGIYSGYSGGNYVDPTSGSIVSP